MDDSVVMEPVVEMDHDICQFAFGEFEDYTLWNNQKANLNQSQFLELPYRSREKYAVMLVALCPSDFDLTPCMRPLPRNALSSYLAFHHMPVVYSDASVHFTFRRDSMCIDCKC